MQTIDNQRPLPVAGDCMTTQTRSEGVIEFWINAQTGGVEPFLRLDVAEDGRLPRYRVMVGYGRAAAVEKAEEEATEADEGRPWVDWVFVSFMFLVMGAWLTALGWLLMRLVGGN